MNGHSSQIVSTDGKCTLRAMAMHEAITDWGPTAEGLQSPATRFGVIELLTDLGPTIGGLQPPATRFGTIS